jgi:chromosomal replication initiator protein
VELDGRARFDNFVVGSANRLAVAAARAVTESPGNVYNPLFVYSASGLGKTHLLHAIGQLARQLQPDLAVELATLDEFVERMHAATSAGQMESFLQRYAHVDLLLVDDIQFVTGRRETQNEMLRLFTALQSAGHQIVLTSDRPPAEIPDVDERLIARLAGGLIVDIGPPDYETRVAILRNKCEERGARFATGVIEEVARADYANVRELQGALHRLMAYEGLGDGAVTPGEVARIVDVRPVTPASTAAAPGAGGEFQSFLSDMAHAVAQNVEGWKARIGEAIAYWSGEGYRVTVLERALQLTRAPDVDGLLSTFAAAVEHLRALEADATDADPRLGGSEVFRDPERVAEAEALVEKAIAGETPPPGPSPEYSRDGYEVSASNQLAVRAADAVVAEPGRKYNPLFIHGPSGVGKTHLAHAIGNEIAHLSGNAVCVACVSAPVFIDELIAALQDGSVDRWRARYRSADALILDDVHFLAGKERTQEELFHVFNTLHATDRQIVFTSDRPPKEMPELEERLRSRFEGGLVVAMEAPDRVLRRKLYARFFTQAGISPDAELLAYLADRHVANVRELLGMVNRLRAAADVAGTTVTLLLARGELEGAGSAPAAAPDGGSAVVDRYFLDNEKIVWDWPDVSGRVIEELR